MKDTLIRYKATITVGDEYHKEGETWTVWESSLDYIKEHGFKLETRKDGFGTTFYHIYPCYITKTVYQLTPTEVTTFPGGKEKIGFDYDEPEYDWKEHWP